MAENTSVNIGDSTSTQSVTPGGVDLNSNATSKDADFRRRYVNNMWIRKNTTKGTYERFIIGYKNIGTWVPLSESDLKSVEIAWNELEAKENEFMAEYDLRWNNEKMRYEENQ